MVLLGSTITFWVLDTIAIWYRYNGGERFCYSILNKLERLKDVETI